MKSLDHRSDGALWPIAFFMIALAVTVTGFWPSFFSILNEVTHSDLLHGWSATSWLVLTVTQAILIGTKRPRLHKALGYLSVALALVVVFTGFGVIQNQTLRNLEGVRLYRYLYDISNTTQLIAFTAFLFMGIAGARRGAIDHHRRFMMDTSLIVIAPPIERLWGTFAPTLVPDPGIAFYASMLTVEAILLALIFFEWRRGKIYPQFPAIFALFAVILFIARPLAEQPWFQHFCLWVAGAR